MRFCTLGKEYLKDGYTQVDNVFFSAYLPGADPTDIKVYLYGLYLAGMPENAENSLEKLAISLKLTEERVTDAFKYWEKKGLITFGRAHPPAVIYRSVKTPPAKIIKYNPSQYEVFVEELAQLFPKRVLSENEQTAYFDLMEHYKMEANTMLMIMQYCVGIKPKVGSAYILAVAADWAEHGIISEADVTAHIAQLELNVEDIKALFQTLNVKAQADPSDHQLYLKWTEEYGYKMDALHVAARSCKRTGGMNKLSRVVDELHGAGAFSAEEVHSYIKAKEARRGFAISIAKMLGIYYGDYDMMIETYIVPWESMGFDKTAVETVAKLCFMRSIRTLSGMHAMMEKFYKLGILTAAGVDAYVQEQIAKESLVKEMLLRAGGTGYTTPRDAEFYRTFVEDWGFTHEAVLAAAEGAAGKQFPMSHINRILALAKERGAVTETDIAALLKENTEAPKKSAVKKKKDDFIQQTYTKEQLRSVFRNLDADDKA